MDDLSEKLSSVLSDPEALEQLKSVASSLFEKKEEPKEASLDLNSVLDGVDIGTITKIMSALKTSPDDGKANLLKALKPMLSDKRKDKVDEAIKLLSLTSLLPLVKEMF